MNILVSTYQAEFLVIFKSDFCNDQSNIVKAVINPFQAQLFIYNNFCFALQEVEIINNVQDLLKKTIDQAEKQIK